jgi:glycosyltransferase involved in cell wall biosynthesis
MFFEVVEGVLKAEPQCCFVCLGGAIGGQHHNEGFEGFKQWTSESPVRDRIHLVGWVPQDEVIEYESEADIGINCDLDIPESWFGDRSRLLSWMARRVVVATTPVSQPSEELVRQGKAVGLPTGDPMGAVGVLLDLMKDKEKLNRIATAAEDHVRTQWSYRETTKALREWAANPVLAGDNRVWFENKEFDFQKELGSLELALDQMFTWGERKDQTRDWKRIHKILLERWPWPDGRRKFFGRD